jgi:hypothetical protein
MLASNPVTSAKVISGLSGWCSAKQSLGKGEAM